MKRHQNVQHTHARHEWISLLAHYTGTEITALLMYQTVQSISMSGCADNTGFHYLASTSRYRAALYKNVAIFVLEWNYPDN
jgi:hypothetical protein